MLSKNFTNGVYISSPKNLVLQSANLLFPNLLLQTIPHYQNTVAKAAAETPVPLSAPVRIH